MVDCKKRQREIYKGTERHRCIHPEAPTKNEIVPLEVCEACPLATIIKKTPCQEKRARPQQDITQYSIPLPVLNDPEYPQCPFRFDGAEGKMCSVTNLGVTPKICHRCEADVKDHEATFGEKVTNYFGALRRWAAHGCPTRSEAEIKELFETHCNKCSMYDREKHACKSCGCKVSSESQPLKNKLAMQTEHCPLGLF